MRKLWDPRSGISPPQLLRSQLLRETVMACHRGPVGAQVHFEMRGSSIIRAMRRLQVWDDANA